MNKAMTLIKYLFQLICFLWLIEGPLLATTQFLAKPGCKDTCGNNVTIPYPFGIGTPDCFLNKWYEVVCHHDRPYLSKYYGQAFGGEVLDVKLEGMRITINANNTVMRVCEDKGIWLASNLLESPFQYFGNSFTFVGCGTVMLFEKQTNLGGCASICDHNITINDCYGINCCQTTLPSVSTQIYMNFSSVVRRNNFCGYVILGNYSTNLTSLLDPSENLLGFTSHIELRWRIPQSMVAHLHSESNVNCYTDTDFKYGCFCPNCKTGNPYILNGCQGRDTGTNCESNSYARKGFIILIVGGTIFCLSFLGTIGLLLNKFIKKKRERKLKQKFFIRNGGLLLQQQLSVDENMVDKVRFFTSTELNKATGYFNENRVIGRGGQGTVYKGMLADGKIVAIKKSKLDDTNQVEPFINEVVLLSQINHRNVVKLLGCCLETDVPLLVYEFVPNGTLYDLMHNEDDEFLMSWETRLRIAAEIGGALAHLHSTTSFPIYHRDIKSSNILLDEKHIAKVSDFGISRHVKIDQTHLTTMVKGTFGYLDPEYFQSHQFTDKSDVYSYGVVLVELLTRRKPILSNHDNTEEGCLSLATMFLISMEEDRLDMILDTQIRETATDEQVTRVAILAQRCLSLDGRKRPTMKEVAMELESIKSSLGTSALQKKIQGERDTEVELVVISDGTSSSWTTTNDTITSSSDASTV